MSVSARLRYEILRRDGRTCRYCGAKAPDVEITVDHVMPVALGGGDEPSNLVAACRDCNAGKSSANADQQVVEDVADDALRWATAMKQAARIQQRHADIRSEQVAQFDAAWSRWTYSDGRTVSRPETWRSTVERWHDAGIEPETLRDLIDDVLPRPVIDGNMWRYFCGAVRNVLTERQRLAREIIDRGQEGA